MPSCEARPSALRDLPTRRGLMLVPPGLEARVAHLIGAPFLAKGDGPEGWDCRGCAHWCLKTLCGVVVPDYRDFYAGVAAGLPPRSDRARLIAEGLADWRAVAPQAGVVAWLEWLGGGGHVGFMLTPRRLLHADMRAGTVILDLNDPAAAYRLRGAFVPGWITEIRHL